MTWSHEPPFMGHTLCSANLILPWDCLPFKSFKSAYANNLNSWLWEAAAQHDGRVQALESERTELEAHLLAV